MEADIWETRVRHQSQNKAGEHKDHKLEGHGDEKASINFLKEFECLCNSNHRLKKIKRKKIICADFCENSNFNPEEMKKWYAA